jgi:hypothetical protein
MKSKDTVPSGGRRDPEASVLGAAMPGGGGGLKPGGGGGKLILSVLVVLKQEVGG